jgi:hypothetical protein
MDVSIYYSLGASLFWTFISYIIAVAISTTYTFGVRFVIVEIIGDAMNTDKPTEFAYRWCESFRDVVLNGVSAIMVVSWYIVKQYWDIGYQYFAIPISLLIIGIIMSLLIVSSRCAVSSNDKGANPDL